MGQKQQVVLAFSVGVFFFSIYVSYAYAFWIGGIWIGNSYYNHILHRLYRGGEGKVAGKFTYEVIDRVPLIDQDSKFGKIHDIKGEIEFKNVEFYYPTRTDTMVLKNFSCTFEKGKTTAIVGPSGSGKSTIV